MRARLIKWLLIACGAMLALLLLVLWLLGRESAMQYAVNAAVERAGGTLTVLGTRGGLYQGIAFDRLQFRAPNQLITLEQGVIRWEPSMWFTRTLLITQAEVATVTIEITGSSTDPLALPASLDAPFSIIAPQVRVKVVNIKQGGQVTRLTDLDLAARYDRNRWDLQRLTVSTPWGAATAALKLDVVKPYALSGEAGLVQAGGGHPYKVAIKLGGSLGEIDAATKLAVKAPNGEIRARLTSKLMPFQRQLLGKIELVIDDASPRTWNVGWPEAALSLRAALAPDGATGKFSGNVELVNRTPGTLDQQRLPLKAMRASFNGDLGAIAAPDITIDLGDAGLFRGSGRWREAAGRDMALTLATGALDLSRIHSRLRKTAIRGDIVVSPADGQVRVVATLADARLALRAEVLAGGDAVDIRRAELTAGKGAITAAGKLQLADARAFELTGKVSHFNPADFGDYPAADLNADFNADGGAAEAWRVHASLAFAPSRLIGRPLTGKAELVATAQTLRDVDVALAIGSNRLNARGAVAFGAAAPAGQKLVWNVDAPRLAELGDAFGGSVTASGEIVSRGAAQQAEASIEARELKLPGGHRFAILSGTVRADGVPSRGLAEMQVKVDATSSGYVSSGIKLTTATLAFDGSLRRHVMRATAANDEINVRADAAGGLAAGNVWRGQVSRLDNRGLVPFALQAPASLLVSAAGQVELGAATLDVSGGKLQIGEFRLAGDMITTRGSASGVPLALAVSFSESMKRNLESTLRLGAAWDISADGERSGRLRGKLRVFRESGDVVFLADARLPAGLEQLELQAEAIDNVINATLKANGRQLGSVDVSASTRAVRRDGGWSIPADAPLKVAGKIDVPSLRWTSRLASEPGLTADGALRASLSADGTVAAPRWRGEVRGSGLALVWPEQGIRYRDGELDVVFNDDLLTVKRLTIQSGEGKLVAEGTLKLSGIKSSGQLKTTLDRFEAVSRPDRVVVASGTGTLQFDENRLSIKGNLKADRGFFELPEKSEVTLSDDIVIVGRTPARDGSDVRMKTQVDLAIDMGKQFRIRGAGLSGRLEGTLRVVSAGTGLPRAVGTLRIEDGLYTVYGQKLSVERGILNFSGPVHNPGVNLLAVRKSPQPGIGVEAGVEVTGSANLPKAKLVSTPNVPDTEKLSWLVLGRGLENSSQTDFSLLSAAASGLLGSSQGASLQSRIAGALGVDEIGFTGPSAGQSGFLSIGKRISSRLFVVYEQGLDRVSNLLKIRYTISGRWSVQAQTGTESAVDVLYTISFD